MFIKVGQKSLGQITPGQILPRQISLRKLTGGGRRCWLFSVKLWLKSRFIFTIYLFGGKKCTYFVKKVLITKSTYSRQFPSRNPGFVKSQIKAAGSITALTDRSGAMVFEQHEVEEVILQHFTSIFDGQRVPVFTSETPPDQLQLALQEIDQMLHQQDPVLPPDHFEEKVCAPYSFVKFDQILQKLPTGKASGYDRFDEDLKINLIKLEDK